MRKRGLGSEQELLWMKRDKRQVSKQVTDISSAYAMSGRQTYAYALHTMPTRLAPYLNFVRHCDLEEQVASSSPRSHHHHLFLNHFFHVQLGSDICPEIKPLHISGLNTNYSGGWKRWIFIISHVHRAFDYMSPFEVLYVHMA